METQRSKWAIVQLERWLSSALSGFVAFVFFHGVYLIAVDWERHGFRMSMQVFSLPWVEVMMWVVPGVYGCIALAIAYRPWRRGGLWAAAAYLSLLGVYLTLGKLRVINICACVGLIDAGGYWPNMQFNAILLGLVLGGLWLDRPWRPALGWFLKARRRMRRREGTAM